MLIGHIQKTSFIDYPGKISAIVFTQGCNFRCPYCHNPELVRPEFFTEAIPEKDILDFLDTRINKLDAVVITGGEPTLQPDLLDFMSEVSKRGFLVKLDTNGTRPHVIEKAVDQGNVDYIAMDIKAPMEKYGPVAGTSAFVDQVRKSIEIIMNSGVEYEFRTTLAASLLTPDDIRLIGREIEGAKRYFLQNFVSSKHVDETYSTEKGFENEDLEILVGEMSSLVGLCQAR